MLRVCIFDFDGTLTDIETDEAAFVSRYQHVLCEALGWDLPRLHRHWDRALQTLQAEPEKYGWLSEGQIMAPANTDPYIRVSCLAALILAGVMEKAAPAEAAEIKIHAYDYATFSTQVFRKTYALSPVHFRKETKHVLNTLLARSDLFVAVVTNSSPEAVGRSLDTLHLQNRDRLHIFGDAQKFVYTQARAFDAPFSQIPSTLHWPGLLRPVQLLRGHYYDVLSHIRAVSGCSLEEMLVCGDHSELDLALPHTLGCSVYLVTRTQTPSYEIHFIEQSERGYVSPSLVDMLKIFS